MRLIDADELLNMTKSYKSELGRLKADPFVKSGIETVENFIKEMSTIIETPTVDAIPIPDGATNGDMIKAMFPNARVDDTFEKFGQLSICTHDVKSVFSSDWWNSPYKVPIVLAPNKNSKTMEFRKYEGPKDV